MRNAIRRRMCRVRFSAIRIDQPPCAHALYVIPGPARPEGLSIVGAIHCYAAAIEHELDRLALVRKAGGAGYPLGRHVVLQRRTRSRMQRRVHWSVSSYSHHARLRLRALCAGEHRTRIRSTGERVKRVPHAPSRRADFARRN